MLTGMVRVPLSPEKVEAGQRLGALLRTARAGRDPEMIARNAGISPETLRKIEVGRMPSPSFGTVVGLCNALGLPLQTAVNAWRGKPTVGYLEPTVP
jgi:DNA-binding phage protein